MKVRHWLLIGITLLAVVSVWFFPPIPQSEAYHHFADTHSIWGIPNALNVLSNIPFVIVGAWGLWVLRKRHNPPFFPVLAYSFFFTGLIFTGIGSAYYHWNPSNHTLVWDRLPMTIAFVSLLSAIIGQLINQKLGIRLLLPLLLLGIGSVAYWYWGELHDHGDLRLYALVQFYPMIAIPLIIFTYHASKSFKKAILGVIIIYALAKVFEATDEAVFEAGQIISGHSLKHIVAAFAILPIINFLRQKELPAMANVDR